MAKHFGGQFLLRIEDLDQGRARQSFVAAIEEDLAWLGLSWPQPVLRQSDRFAAYRQAVEKLHALDVLYPCAATRSEIQAAAAIARPGNDPDGTPLYPGRGRVISEDRMCRSDEGWPTLCPPD